MQLEGKYKLYHGSNFKVYTTTTRFLSRSRPPDDVHHLFSFSIIEEAGKVLFYDSETSLKLQRSSLTNVVLKKF